MRGDGPGSNGAKVGGWVCGRLARGGGMRGVAVHGGGLVWCVCGGGGVPTSRWLCTMPAWLLCWHRSALYFRLQFPNRLRMHLPDMLQVVTWPASSSALPARPRYQDLRTHPGLWHSSGWYRRFGRVCVSRSWIRCWCGHASGRLSRAGCGCICGPCGPCPRCWPGQASGLRRWCGWGHRCHQLLRW